MRFQVVLIASTVLFALGVTSAPLPSFQDIEKRWIKGETEAQIHASHDIRNASPAWPLERDAESSTDAEFAYATDRKTLESRLRGRRERPGLYGVVRRMIIGGHTRSSAAAFVLQSRSNHDEAPVLKPRKIMRYHFTA